MAATGQARAVRCPQCGQKVAMQTPTGHQIRHEGRVYDVAAIFSVKCENCKTTFKPGEPGKGRK